MERVTKTKENALQSTRGCTENRCSPEWLSSDFRKMRKVENYATFTTVSLRRSVA